MRGILSLVCAFTLVCLVAASDLSVATKYGVVTGYSTTTHKVWKGIPFAEPPVGNLRWQPPQAPTPWTTEKNTSEWGNFCVQRRNGVIAGSEDCLYLNIWVPINANLSNPSLSVLMFIYGGSFTGGSSNDYEGEYLAGSDLIYVNFNYRVGALGFMYHPSLAAESSVGTSGFYGMQDQRAAFEWVRDNIAAFGGNPNKVTVSAESAGAISLCLHLITPRSKGLFQQVISESGFCTSFTQAEGSLVGNYIAYKLNCSGETVVSCMRQATPTQLVEANPVGVFYPTSHPYELSDSPVTEIKNGNFNPVPIMGGTNANESAYIFCPNFGNSISYEQFVNYINNTYAPGTINKSLNELLSLYNVSNYPSAISALIALASDRSFKCFTKTLFQESSKVVPTYMYSFEIVPAFAPNSCYGAAHAYELDFLYPSYLAMNSRTLTTGEQSLAQKMRDAWANFTVSGTAIVEGAQAWPAYKEYIIFDLSIGTGANFREPYCSVWNQSTLHAIGVALPTIPSSYPIIPLPSATTTTTSSDSTTSVSTSNSPTTTTSSFANILSPGLLWIAVIFVVLHKL